jgi:hypothetical protein
VVALVVPKCRGEILVVHVQALMASVRLQNIPSAQTQCCARSCAFDRHGGVRVAGSAKVAHVAVCRRRNARILARMDAKAAVVVIARALIVLQQ